MKNLDTTKNYIVNPLIRGRWENKSSVVLQNILTKKKYTFKFPVFDLMLYCGEQRSVDEITEKVQKDFGVEIKEAKSIVDELLKIGFLTEKDQFNYDLWFERNWRNALYLHLLTSDNTFVDMGQPDEAIVKTNLLKDYLSDSPLPPFYKKYEKTITLPKPKMEFVSAGNVLLNRRTTRRFDKSPISLEQLSTILFYASQPAKIVRDYADSKRKDDPIIFVLSSYTPFEIYFSVNNVESLQKGLYHYNMNKHKIHLIKKGEFNKDMKKIAIGQVVEDASVVFLISSVLERYMWRYRNSGAYRNLLIECSSLAHRIIVATEALGLKQFLTPAIRDSIADGLFGLDGYSETFTYLVAIGNQLKKK